MVNNELTIVINTFNSEDVIFKCLNSIQSNQKVYVIENSNNESLKKKIETIYPNVSCHLTGSNLGYAKGNNYGLSKVRTKYALVLNPDTTLEKNTIDNFINSASNLKDFAILAPALQNEFDKHQSLKDKPKIFKADKVKGFAMFLNLPHFKDIGFFDENFFIYLEEIDLCKRVIDKKKNIYLDKSIIINHLGGKSHNSEINYEMELSRNWHWMWSTFYFDKKYYGFLIALLKIQKKLFSSFFKSIFYFLILNKEKEKIYLQRLKGIIASIFGKKSSYRPKIKKID